MSFCVFSPNTVYLAPRQFGSGFGGKSGFLARPTEAMESRRFKRRRVANELKQALVWQALWEEHYGDGRVPIKEDAKPKVEMLNLMVVVLHMMGALCWSSVLRLCYGKEVVAWPLAAEAALLRAPRALPA